MSKHPITPPPELLEQWEAEVAHTTLDELSHVATQAARWGADQELEACTTWLLLNGWGQAINGLRAARRPKPPSLKEQALTLLNDASDRLDAVHENTIRCALESLSD